MNWKSILLLIIIICSVIILLPKPAMGASVTPTVTVANNLTAIETYDPTEYSLTIYVLGSTFYDAHNTSDATTIITSGYTVVHAIASTSLTYGTLSSYINLYAYSTTIESVVVVDGFTNSTFITGTYVISAIETFSSPVTAPTTFSVQSSITVSIRGSTTGVSFSGKSKLKYQMSPSRFTAAEADDTYRFSIDGGTSTVTAVYIRWTKVNSTSYVYKYTTTAVFDISDGITNGTMYSLMKITVIATVTSHYIAPVTASTYTSASDWLLMFGTNIHTDVMDPLGRMLYLGYITAEFLFIIGFIFAGVGLFATNNRKKWLTYAGLIILGAFIMRFGPAIVDYIANW